MIMIISRKGFEKAAKTYFKVQSWHSSREAEGPRSGWPATQPWI